MRQDSIVEVENLWSKAFSIMSISAVRAEPLAPTDHQCNAIRPAIEQHLLVDISYIGNHHDMVVQEAGRIGSMGMRQQQTGSHPINDDPGTHPCGPGP